MAFVRVWIGLAVTSTVLLSGATAGAGEAKTPASVFKGRVQYTGQDPDGGADKPTLDTRACGNKPKVDRDRVVAADGGLGYAVVTVRPAEGTLPSQLPTEVKMDQLQCEFLPFTVLVPKGGKVRVTNSDPTLHNVHMKKGFGGQSLRNVAQTRRSPPLELVLEDLGPFRIECDIHYWMTAWAFVTEDPAGTVANEKGEFELSLPPGKYRVTIWHLLTGSQEQEMTVKAGEKKTTTFKVGPAKS